MTFPTSWNLARYFYTGLDDPKFLADIASILPMTHAFAEKYRDTFSKFSEPKEILQFYTDYTNLSYEMAKAPITIPMISGRTY